VVLMEGERYETNERLVDITKIKNLKGDRDE
jgi:hypothetical protein